jgi:hypothetical protein
MFAAASQFLPAAGRFCRQIVPPVVATLIAAGLISTYNRSFSGHLSQPRMGGLNDVNAADGTTAPITTVAMTKPPAAPTAPATETITIYEEVIAPERLWEKDAKEEAGKDQSPIKLAADPPPAPVRTASPAPKPEPKVEPGPEPHRVAAVELAQPVVRAPVPVIVAVPPAVVAPPASAPVVAAMPGVQEQRPPQYPRSYPPQVHPYPQPYQPYPPQVQHYPQPQYQPPPVIVGTPPMVTVPDRPNARPVEQAQAQPAPPAQGAFGTFVHVLKPSTWFAHAREFGQKIEDAGNDILPSIRQ